MGLLPKKAAVANARGDTRCCGVKIGPAADAFCKLLVLSANTSPPGSSASLQLGVSANCELAITSVSCASVIWMISFAFVISISSLTLALSRVCLGKSNWSGRFVINHDATAQYSVSQCPAVVAIHTTRVSDCSSQNRFPSYPLWHQDCQHPLALTLVHVTSKLLRA